MKISNKNILVNYFTIFLCFLLLCIIILKKNNRDIQFYILIIIILLIIISCLIDISSSNLNYMKNIQEDFKNLDLNKNCFNRNKEFNYYHNKIHQRTKNTKYIEQKNRKNLLINYKKLKLKELKEHNKDYLVNGESF